MKTQETLITLTGEFYTQQAQSFSNTRQYPWLGWNRVLEKTEAHIQDSQIRVLDLACGNLRFERHCLETLPNIDWQFTCVDSCKSLVAANVLDVNALSTLDFIEFDYLTSLIHGDEKAVYKVLHQKHNDLSCAFGFFHHIPVRENRVRSLLQLISATESGGLVAISLWRFMDEPSIANKVLKTTQRACDLYALNNLESNDYLLGWKDEREVFRYCHHFNEQEINQLITAVAAEATLVDRFDADGRTGNLNTYLIFLVK